MHDEGIRENESYLALSALFYFAAGSTCSRGEHSSRQSRIGI